MGDGHHGWAASEFLSFVRTMLVRELDDGIALASMLPERWLGQGIEVHDAPTRFGTVSFAIRWHGERPALLWELDRTTDAPVSLTCPGLDPSWRTTDDRGEALLQGPDGVSGIGSGQGAESPADGPGPDAGDSFG